MTRNSNDENDPLLRDLITRAPNTQAPSAGFTKRVLNELRDRDLIRAERTRAHRMLIAASWFVAGTGVGAGVHYTVTRDAEHSRASVAASAAQMNAGMRAARPDEVPTRGQLAFEPLVWY